MRQAGLISYCLLCALGSSRWRVNTFVLQHGRVSKLGGKAISKMHGNARRGICDESKIVIQNFTRRRMICDCAASVWIIWIGIWIVRLVSGITLWPTPVRIRVDRVFITCEYSICNDLKAMSSI